MYMVPEIYSRTPVCRNGSYPGNTAKKMGTGIPEKENKSYFDTFANDTIKEFDTSKNAFKRGQDLTGKKE
ncbi:hypothetical protein [uncultured Methanofollis sp.]|uniref:hypothetical protein n=1 Tax=uncultured Methanofollis sp. TaxID=262500 RepID=UPI00261C61A3|nr:hypothetical protein [uncultured Methanofollis sp.]